MIDDLRTFADGAFAPLHVRAEDLALDEKFEELYRSTLPRIYALVRSQVANAQIAQDIVSRIFLKAYAHREHAPRGAVVTPWLFRIAHTTLIDHWRVDGKRAAATVSLDELADVPGAAANPETAYALKERQVMLLRVMGDLPEHDRIVLALKFAGQRTNREIATILNLSEGAVSMRLLRALRRLRERFQHLGIS